MPKNVQTATQLHSSLTLANDQTSPSQAESMWAVKFQMVKLDFKKAEEPQIKLPTSKHNVKAVYCHTAYLTYMQSTSWEILGWMKHKQESDCWE